VADAGDVFRAHRGADCRWVVVVLDLDAFRDVNHTLGHDTGNRLLEMIADRLRPGWPAGSVQPARIGQDEFALLLDASAEPDFVGWTRRRLDRLEEPFDLDGVVVEVSASAGLAVFPDDGADAELLLRHAEVALREGKGSRASVSRYHADADPYQPDRLRMIAGLREAIQGEQLLLHYQPKIDLATSRAMGAEALVRWRHPNRGLLLPGEFIGLAEQTGQIRALTDWVIRSAARDMAQLAGRADGFGLSLNISARNLLDEDLPETLAATFGEVDAPPSMLGLEITESAILRDPQGARQILDRLAGVGFRVAIDDFGTGYSSLSHLKELPVRELKIDRSFVTTLTEDRRNAAIVRSTVRLAHDLELETTAEGVETEPVLELLRSFGCDMAQGFLMARPMPVDQLLAWLEAPGW
jgi:diguanylate cyclase (GGDEF)-like protein